MGEARRRAILMAEAEAVRLDIVGRADMARCGSVIEAMAQARGSATMADDIIVATQMIGQRLAALPERTRLPLIAAVVSLIEERTRAIPPAPRGEENSG